MLEEMNALRIDEFDCLPFEYQRDYRTTLYELDISDFVNNPFIHCKPSILNLGCTEKPTDFLGGKVSMLRDDVPDSLLVFQDTI